MPLASPPAIAPPVAAVSPHTRGAQARLLLNLSANVVYTGLQSLANLWMTPFLIAHLGLAAYGMVPLAASIITYAALITTALDSSVSRFLALELEKEDHQSANQVFNTAFFSLVGVFLALTPIVLVIGFSFSRIFKVPPGWELETSILFFLTSAGFFVTVMSSNFSVSPFLRSRFLALNAVNLAGLTLRIGLIALLFIALPAHLWYAGAATLAGALVALAGFMILWRQTTPQLRIRWSSIDLGRLRVMVSMAGWLVVNMAGAMLLSRADLLVVNAWFGAAASGGYASIIQFALLLEYIANAASIALRPLILAEYARGNFAGLKRMAGTSVKLLGLALALPVGLLCGFASPLLSVWLGPSFTGLALLMVVAICHNGINYSVRPLLFVQNAYNKVRGPGLVTLLTGVLAVLLAIASAAWTDLGMVGVALAVGLTWTAKNAVYMPLYTARIMGLPWWTFLFKPLPGVAATLVIALTGWLIQVALPVQSWLRLGGAALVMSVLYALVAWLFLLTAGEQRMLLEQLHLRRPRRPIEVER